MILTGIIFALIMMNTLTVKFLRFFAFGLMITITFDIIYLLIMHIVYGSEDRL